MKLFVSYPSEERDLAERLRLALEAEGHDVFTDRAGLRAGEAFHAELREAIADCDAAIFLLTPRAVAPGSYTLSELDQVQLRWRRPSGRVLPVIVQATPLAQIPPYLKAVTLLQPRGDVVAEVAAAVAVLRPPGVGWALAAAGVAAALVVGAAGWWFGFEQPRRERAEAEAAAAAQAVARAASAAALCRDGAHAAAWDALAALAAAPAAPPAVHDAALDCGMRWLREARVARPQENFADIVDKVQPELVRGLAAAAGAQRQADLRAHIGYAEFLRGRDGPARSDPMPQYEAALAADPGNVYALVMRAHLHVWRGGALGPAQRADLDAAARSGRERPWVRTMQWAVASLRGELNRYALQVADEMRRNAEPLDDGQRRFLWNRPVGDLMGADVRGALLQVLPPDAWHATFVWAFPRPADADERLAQWRFTDALLRRQRGERDAAVAELRALRRELHAARAGGRIADAVDAVLAAP